jgi:hypothetical protein
MRCAEGVACDATGLATTEGGITECAGTGFGCAVLVAEGVGVAAGAGRE